MPSPFERRSRAGVSEVVSSLALLTLTIALLGGMAAMAAGSVQGSGSLIALSSQSAARGFGLMLALVSVQSNSSGSFAWVYDYGWEQGRITNVYVNGGAVNWASSCAGLIAPGKLCAILLPRGSQGQVTLVVGTKSLDYSV